MPAKKRAPKREHKQDDPDQPRRFVEMARDLKADETGREFRKGLNLLTPKHRAAILKRSEKP